MLKNKILCSVFLFLFSVTSNAVVIHTEKTVRAFLWITGLALVLGNSAYHGITFTNMYSNCEYKCDIGEDYRGDPVFIKKDNMQTYFGVFGAVVGLLVAINKTRVRTKTRAL